MFERDFFEKPVDLSQNSNDAGKWTEMGKPSMWGNVSQIKEGEIVLDFSAILLWFLWIDTTMQTRASFLFALATKSGLIF